MLHPAKLPEHIKADIAANRRWDDLPPEERDARIARLDARTALDYYLAWHGLIGWAGTVLAAVDGIRGAVREEEAA